MVLNSCFGTCVWTYEIVNVLKYLGQDEIWGEVVLKRIKAMRDNTKEGIFSSIPYSFMTASLRSRYAFSFSFSVVRAVVYAFVVL